MGKKRKKVGTQRQREKAPMKPDRLRIWQDRLAKSNADWCDEAAAMDKRERIYKGDRRLEPLDGSCLCDQPSETVHVRNVVFENIESMVSSAIPQPKVTAVRKKDEPLAHIIERFLRNELDRQPFEVNNDMAERTVPIQGGVLHWGQWDNSIRTHNTIRSLEVSVLHPKLLAPQPGVYTGIDDMDWFVLKVPSTKGAVLRRYGVDVEQENEAEPELRGTGNEDHSDDAVTLYVGYEVGEDGGINKFAWVGNTTIEDLEDYQARRQPTCCGCGRLKPNLGQLVHVHREQAPKPEEAVAAIMAAGQLAAMQMGAADVPMAQDLPADGIGIPVMAGEEPEPVEYMGGACPWCGCRDFEDRPQKYEEVFTEISRAHGPSIPGATWGLDEAGVPAMKPTLIPYYKPDMYPVVLQRSVSVYGQLLGNSDVDMIADQQATINRLEHKIITRLMMAGTRVTLPDKLNMKLGAKDGQIWRIGNPADKAMIGVYEFKGDLQYELAYLNQVYEEPRQILGITDSFQGRRDPTATSGKAKEYAAQMAAGRMDSKRVMKNAAYARLFEMMFKFWLAYADEPRPLSWKDSNGDTVYGEFNRYDFLERDADGQYYWNDQFLFSVDNAAPLERDRATMWQELRMNLQTGAFGDPTKTETLILFWTKMDEQHYPGAASTKEHLEARLKREQEQAMQMQAMMAQQNMGRMGQPAGAMPNTM